MNKFKLLITLLVAVSTFGCVTSFMPESMARTIAEKDVETLETHYNTISTEYAKFDSALTEFAKATEGTQKSIDNIVAVFESITNVESKVIAASDKLKSMSDIPVVGYVTKTTATALDMANVPISESSDAIRSVEDQIELASSKMKEIDTAMKDTSENSAEIKKLLNILEQPVASLSSKLESAEDSAAIASLSNSTKMISSSITKIEDNIAALNSALVPAKEAVNLVESLSDDISSTSKSISSFVNSLNYLEETTEKIELYLEKKINVPLIGTISVKDALGKTGISNTMAKPLLEPQLDKLEQDFPDIKGLDSADSFITEDMQDVSDKFNTTLEELNAFNKRAKNISTVANIVYDFAGIDTEE